MLVVARGAAPNEAHKSELGRLLFGLSPTEAAMAAKLACGVSPQGVAEALEGEPHGRRCP